MGAMKCAMSERLVRLGISMAQLHIMYTLQRNGEMTMSRLADVLDVSSRAPRASSTGSRSAGSSNGPASRRSSGRAGPRDGGRDPDARGERRPQRRADARRPRPAGPGGAAGDRPRRREMRAALEATAASPHEICTRPPPPGHDRARRSDLRPGARPDAGARHDYAPKEDERNPWKACPPAYEVPSLEDDPALGLSHRAKMEILFAVMLGLFLGALDQTIVGPALPTIVTQLSGQRLLRLGHHDLPADQHDQRPVLGQAVRPLRPQADLHDRHRRSS